CALCIELRHQDLCRAHLAGCRAFSAPAGNGSADRHLCALDYTGPAQLAWLPLTVWLLHLQQWADKYPRRLSVAGCAYRLSAVTDSPLIAITVHIRHGRHSQKNVSTAPTMS